MVKLYQSWIIQKPWTYIDSGSTNTAYESSSELIVGRSPLTHQHPDTFSIIDMVTLPIPNCEFIDATLTLNKISGGENGKSQ